jgi:hypothetical protein
MRRTFADLDAELLLRLANRNDITVAMRAHFIRDAVLNIAMLFRHPELELNATETLALGDDFLAPTATDIWFPSSLRNETDDYLLRLEARERVERSSLKPTAPPYTYFWYRRVFFFEAKANTAKQIKIWYKRKPVEFSSSANCELDELFDIFIVMDAARIGFETVRDFDEAQKQLALFSAEAQRKKIPLDQAKLDDYRQGFRVRTR